MKATDSVHSNFVLLNLLQRNSSFKEINQLGVSDITCIPTDEAGYTWQ